MKPNNGRWDISCVYAQLEWKTLQLANYQYNSNNITVTAGQGAGQGVLGGGYQLTLGGTSVQGAQSITMDDGYLTNLFKNNNDNVKRYEVIETSEDILALSVAWKRLRDNREKVPVYINSLLSNMLFEKVTNEDRLYATEIRDYFSKKIMLWTLKDIKLSQYRQDLSELIHSDGKKIVDKMLPIAFRLPEFYEYDVDFDKFKQKVKLDISDINSQDVRQRITTLKPVKSFYKSNKRIKQFEYWLTDNKGNANMIVIEPKNPLKHIWDTMFMNEHLRIEATYYPKKYDDLQYYQVLNWKLA